MLSVPSLIQILVVIGVYFFQSHPVDNKSSACTPIITFITEALQRESREVVREEIEWLDVWVPGNGNKELPKVLLIGDSIARGYYKEVEDKLRGKAVVARLTTSKSLGDPAFLAEVQLILTQTRFAVVHFNNGLHGWGYTEEVYAKALPALLTTLRTGAPDAKLIWATTTPVRVADKLVTLADKTDRVKKRNTLAASTMAQAAIPTNDLFSVVADKPEWYSRDGVHFNAKGNAALAKQVADTLRQALPVSGHPGK